MGIKHLPTCFPIRATHLVNWLPTPIQWTWASPGMPGILTSHLAHEKTDPEREATHWNLFSWKN